MNEHWFDALGKRVARPVRRRETLRAAAALAAGLLLGGEEDIEAGRKKPKPKPRCGRAECAAAWPGDTKEDRDNRDACERKCGKCRIRSKFCIHRPSGDDTNPKPKRATCCFEDQVCCGPSFDGLSACCASDRCCTGPEGKFCLGEGGACCPDDSLGFCTGGQQCCPGVGCVTGQCPAPCPRDRNGGCECPDDQEFCTGRCIDTSRDPLHCGGCGSACEGNKHCIDGSCQCPAPEYELCPVWNPLFERVVEVCLSRTHYTCCHDPLGNMPVCPGSNVCCKTNGIGGCAAPGMCNQG